MPPLHTINSSVINMKVSRITILVSHTGTDSVSLHLDATTPFPELGYPAHARVEVRAGYGPEWTKQNFPDVADVEVIDGRTGRSVSV